MATADTQNPLDSIEQWEEDVLERYPAPDTTYDPNGGPVFRVPGGENEYAVHDTKAALNEARAKGITPFVVSVLQGNLGIADTKVLQAVIIASASNNLLKTAYTWAAGTPALTRLVALLRVLVERPAQRSDGRR